MMIILKVGNDTIAVNPDHVTLIEPAYKNAGKDMSGKTIWEKDGVKLWVKANAGYGTKEFRINRTVEEVTAMLNTEAHND